MKKAAAEPQSVTMRNKGSRDDSHGSKNSTGRGLGIGFEDSNAEHNIGGGVILPGYFDVNLIGGHALAQ